MRRVLTFLTAIVLLLVSLGVGVFTADLPFWRRAFQLPLPAGRCLPTRGHHRHPGAAARCAEAANRRAAGNRRAGGRGSRQSRRRRRIACLVSHVPRRRSSSSAISSPTTRTRCCPPRWWRARSRPWRSASRSPKARIASLDDPGRALPARVGRRGARPHHAAPAARGNQRARDRRRHPRPAVSLAVERPGDAAGLRHLARRAHVVRQRFRVERARLPARSRAGRLLQPSRRPTRSSPRSSSSAPPASPTKISWTQRLWRPVGAGVAELQLDRRAGMPAAHCCWRATARDMLRMLGLLGTDGVHDGRAVLPAGWVARDGAGLARERRDRHAGDAAQHRWRGSAHGHGRRRQRVLGHSAAAARHPQHREPGRQRGRGPAGMLLKGIEVPAHGTVKGASIGSKPGEPARKMRAMDMKVSLDAIVKRFLDSREFARMTRAIEFIEREYQRQPKLAEIAQIRRALGIPFQPPVPPLDRADPQAVPRRGHQPRRGHGAAQRAIGAGRRSLCRTLGRRAVA